MTAVPKFKLNTGALIPAVGLGGWSGTTKEQHAQATTWMLTAIKSGYRHIDTAWAYGTEKYVAEAVQLSGIPREEIWITTKLPWSHPGLKTAEESLDESLKNLDTSYVDLYLLHWPQVIDWPDEGPEYQGPVKIRTNAPSFNETWAQIEELHKKGKAKNIGVSNFSVKNLEKLFKTAKITPAVNQVELHPYLAQPQLKEYCDAKGIVLTAYTPTGWDIVRSDPTIVELAEKYKVSPAQIILAWHLGRGIAVVPKSSNASRQRDNLNLPTLSPEDVQHVTALNRNQRLCNKPDENGMVGGWTVEEMGW
ncbi:NADP-dependent oxidoreductase domain-containing protein [Rhodofomes roseus]|uniref:NADP-dependent oxidoreductase domain-containing protein n=1 Tax=Rhodofomes roseus TaxID=34475 RepID=A0ABQ8KY29_9APHY|nr:NADP-dependent oxidoreductase domain-containing protein [Rhodofomes roseus]KAH9844151.1 NADP-dependent oxidoreductase domain-containing protein [Rhodofomes roseus]